MRPIHPINEEQCRPYYGQPVFIILKDGTELVGTLSRLDKGKLYLNEATAGIQSNSSAPAKSKRSGANSSSLGKARSQAKKSDKLRTTATNEEFPEPYPDSELFGGPFELDVASVGALIVPS
ncbi:hypothetical protein [Paenibacillus ehimensis]|uniref:Uncharacterized protein n=1 Tax=Paenibacillus ehimensis TaxID=79264 RepID=A0ABT8VJG9_9BACL|nr:hypothetical protein [Paenibacillus ehimensis]MDO3681076.1 hypothetical protein [Paenibacillus ehimensis]MEC0212457.1 hypothetical protein [Paenibacillus ehimensis]